MEGGFRGRGGGKAMGGNSRRPGEGNMDQHFFIFFSSVFFFFKRETRFALSQKAS